MLLARVVDVCWKELVDEAAEHDVADEVEGVGFRGHLRRGRGGEGGERLCGLLM